MILLVAGTSTDPGSLLLNYGPVGVVALMLALRLLVPKSTYEDAIRERDEARAALAASQAQQIARQDDLVPRTDYQVLHDDLAKLRTKMEDTMLPGMFRATDTLDKTLQIFSRLAERAPL